jgi:hypothetical protein
MDLVLIIASGVGLAVSCKVIGLILEVHHDFAQRNQPKPRPGGHGRSSHS